jgi:hypothetical protein
VVEEEDMEVGKALSEFKKKILLKGSDSSVSRMPCAPEEATGLDFYCINDISS